MTSTQDQTSINSTIETSNLMSRTSSLNPHLVNSTNKQSNKQSVVSIASTGSEISDEESLADYDQSNDQSSNRSSEWNRVSRDGSYHHSFTQSTHHTPNHNNSLPLSPHSIDQSVDQSVIRHRARYQLDSSANQSIDQSDNHCSCGDVPLKELHSLIRLRPNHQHPADQPIAPSRRSSINQSINQSTSTTPILAGSTKIQKRKTDGFNETKCVNVNQSVSLSTSCNLCV